MSFDTHAHLLGRLHSLFQQRVTRGWDERLMSQQELARRSGVPQPNISAIFAGKPCREATWDRLFTAALAPPDPHRG